MYHNEISNSYMWAEWDSDILGEGWGWVKSLYIPEFKIIQVSANNLVNLQKVQINFLIIS